MLLVLAELVQQELFKVLSQGLLSNEDISVKRSDHGVIEEACLITMSTIIVHTIYLMFYNTITLHISTTLGILFTDILSDHVKCYCVQHSWLTEYLK